MITGFTRPSARGGSRGVRPGVVSALLLFAAVTTADSHAPVGSRTAYGLLSDSLDVLGGAASGQAEVALLACSLDRGDTLLAIAPSRRLIPGSNAKLFTTGAFLRRFGPEYRRETVLAARGKATAHGKHRAIRFKGDLVLRASGMPDIIPLLSPGSLGLLDSLAALLRAGGLERFNGTLWVDGSVFATEPYGPGWAHDDFAYSYGAPVNAFLTNGNAATLIATGTEHGVVLALDPPEVPLVLRGTLALGDSSASARLSLHRAPGSRVLEVSGVVPRGGAIRRQVAVIDPDSTAGLMLRGAMRRAGIKVEAGVRVLPPQSSLGREGVKGLSGLYASPLDSGAGTVTPAWDRADSKRAWPVLSLASARAAEVAGIVNAVSLNAEAEALLRLLDPAPAMKSRERGLRELMTIAANAGIDSLDLSLVDGSGLSPMNLVTPRAVVTWLTAFGRDSALAPAFEGKLAQPGALGTMKNRLTGLDPRTAFRGKSGTLTNVSALSGYVSGATGERIVFSMLSNGNRGSVVAAREAEDHLVGLLSRFRREIAPTPRPIGIPR